MLILDRSDSLAWRKNFKAVVMTTALQRSPNFILSHTFICGLLIGSTARKSSEGAIRYQHSPQGLCLQIPKWQRSEGPTDRPFPLILFTDQITLNGYLLIRKCVYWIENIQIWPVLQTSFHRGDNIIALADYAGILSLRWSLRMTRSSGIWCKDRILWLPCERGGELLEAAVATTTESLRTSKPGYKVVMRQ